jgi:hypothetical protein
MIKNKKEKQKNHRADALTAIWNLRTVMLNIVFSVILKSAIAGYAVILLRIK